MKFVFVHMGIEFDGDSLKQRGLGGTETALIGVSRELAALPDNEVHVFTNTPKEACFDGVHYHPLAQLGPWAKSNHTDILISIRQWLPFWMPIKARHRVYFSPDSYDQPFLQRAVEVALPVKGESTAVPLFKPQEFFSALDSIFCVGQWQADQFVSKLQFPQDKIFVTANGVFLENFQPLALEERKRHLIYSSTPFRGLDHLIRYFSELKAEGTDLNLEICSGMQVYGLSDEDNKKGYGHLFEAIKQLGAISHGSIKQSELAKIMCQGLLCTYPNTFEETFCISVLEAQAAGLPVITSAKGALLERVSSGVDGLLIKGEPAEESYKRDFIAAVKSLSQDVNRWQSMSQAAVQKAQKFSYKNLAQQWMAYFDSLNIYDIEASKKDIPNFGDYLVDLNDGKNTKLSINKESILHILQQYFSLFGFQ
ncbi:MAG: glycosyltransferase family 4 protein [Deltaproteobacteria bacterium]|nr:glycosyltransferase family 4 protein [Deltaproteobacteria bacterium]